MSYDPQELEATWRERWAESGRYEADPDGRDEATFVTVPYPYPSGGMHIGHARTYTVPDVYARYRRQQGDNVLFPLGWHVTGTPIIGAVERLKKGEEKQLSVLRDTYNVPEETLRDLETPMGFARYFIEEHYKKGMVDLGLSIDWRREFTTNDERYSRFITWQYETLRERGLLEKGLHPVKYCTEQENPVTTHDLLEGETVEYQEYTLVKFEDTGGEELVFPMATLRPETVRGVTNAYVDPEATYVEATVDGERWVVAEEAVEKLELQDHEVTVERETTGAAYVGERISNPVTDDEVLILPADFVDPDSGSGVVMSVPAHSPDDYLALQAAKADESRLREYDVDPEAVAAIEPIPILSVDGYGEIPARDAVESHGVTDAADPDLKAVTQEVYNKEFHQGVLNDEYGEYGGEIVEEVRDDLKAHFQSQGAFDAMYDFPEPVISRAGGKVVVSEQETWFLRYNDAAWKEKTLEAVADLDAIPENTREQYEHTVGWLEEWPCIRNYGLGTPLPWDDEFVIEPLSDSTIYMAYYTIAHRLADVPVEDLTPEFFDTLLLGEGEDETALELREEFDYWYPVDYRCSGNDLISNHLTFFLYHHAELFETPQWPQGITIMGMGLLEGEKMSSSKGHVVLPGEAISTYGADTVRFFLLNSSEPWQDYDWRADEVGAVRDQLERFWNRAVEIIERAADESGDEDDLERVDYWLLAKLQECVREVTAAMERFETRSASQTAFYRFEEHLKWYRRRTDLERPGAQYTLRTVLETRLRLLAPFVPFLANELHERLTGEPAEDVPWPAVVPEFDEPTVIEEERLVASLADDVRDIVEVTGDDPETVRVYAPAAWKREVFETVVEEGPNQGAVMGTVMQNEALREKGNAVNALVSDLVSFVRERDEATLEVLAEIDERSVYADATDFLAAEFDADVEVYAEDGDPVDPAGKAAHAQPFRPAIHLE
ncbi:leucine--tRNA ligase [Natronobiforma cellulositropha]|uniref:leucine--tRNA ligase n=1 Tax=Natronobiforma cellulositropha TaxID=1679076 RepID=UPI0021D5E4B3|nr:leucine--tRNA ligase [Natronobiforma cellulositropha]